MDEGVGGGAVSKDTVNTEVVSQVTVGARAWGALIFPETRIVGAVFSLFKTEKPLVPRESTELQGAPYGGVKMVVRVLCNQVLSPDSVGGAA